MRATILVLVLLLAAGCSSPAGPPSVPGGMIEVLVQDMEFRLLPGVDVVLVELGQANVTDPTGAARFGPVAAGRYNVSASRPGFFNASGFVDVRAGESSTITLRMVQPPPVWVPQVWRYVGDGACNRHPKTLPTDASDPCPSRSIPASVSGKPDGDPYPAFIEALNVSVEWSGAVKEFQVELFLGSRAEPRPLLNGTYSLIAKGASPLRFAIPREQLWGPVLRSDSMEVALAAVDAPEEFDQPYRVAADAPFALYLDAEKGPRWNESRSFSVDLRPGESHAFAQNDSVEYVRFQFTATGDCYAGQREPVVAVFTGPGGFTHRVTIATGSEPYVTTCAPPPSFGRPIGAYIPRLVGDWTLKVESACTCTVGATAYAGWIERPAE